MQSLNSWVCLTVGAPCAPKHIRVRATVNVKKNSITLGATGAARLQKDHGILFFPQLRGEALVQGADHLLERFSQHLPAKFMPLGAYSYSRSFFTNVARIGRYCSVGERVTVMGNRHPVDWASSNPVFYRRKRAKAWGSARALFPEFDDLGPPVEIADDVWIGDDVLLAHGVKLGTGCVVAARAVVTHDVPPYAIVAGTPARVIRLRFSEQVVERMLASAWWDWPVSAWDAVDPRAIDAFLARADMLRDSLPRLPEARFTPAQLIASQDTP
ncbi:MAG: hypothetical protein RLZZ437_1445 [Pseudomonadota bacterium]